VLKYFLACIVLATSGSVGWYTFQHVETDVATPLQPPKSTRLAVTVVSVQSRKLIDEVELVGSLEADAEVIIRSPGRGYITQVMFDVGHSVQGPTSETDGQLVVQIDDELQREKLSRMQAAWKVQQADIRAHEAKRDLAEATVTRQIPALESAAVTQQEHEESLAQLSIAKAELALSQALLVEANSAIEEARIELDKCSLTAPMTGEVAERLVEVGDLANPDDPILRIVSIDRIKMVIHVAEKDYQKVHVGQKAIVQVDPFPNERFKGVLTRKSPVLDPETRTAEVFVEIPNHEHLLNPGMHARVKLVFEERKGIKVIPKTALLENGDVPTVFVVEGNPPVAKRCSVLVGMVTDQFVEILQGLETNQQVILLGNRLLKNGQSVSPVLQSEDIKVVKS